jgi:hypothetical protein
MVPEPSPQYKEPATSSAAVKPGFTVIPLSNDKLAEIGCELSPARNYVFIQKKLGGRIDGVYHVNTDLQAPFDRFMSDKERKDSVNLHVEAPFIRATIIVSGSKQASVNIKVPRANTYTGGGNNSSVVVRLVSETDKITSSNRLIDITPSLSQLQKHDDGSLSVKPDPFVKLMLSQPQRAILSYLSMCLRPSLASFLARNR